MEMRPSGRIGGHIVVVVDKSSKPPLCDSDGQSVEAKERMGGNGVAIEGPHERPTNNNVIIESLDEDRRYPTRGRRPFG